MAVLKSDGFCFVLGWKIFRDLLATEGHDAPLPGG
jgi:hypothetical protein